MNIEILQVYFSSEPETNRWHPWLTVLYCTQNLFEMCQMEEVIWDLKRKHRWVVKSICNLISPASWQGLGLPAVWQRQSSFGNHQDHRETRLRELVPQHQKPQQVVMHAEEWLQQGPKWTSPCRFWARVTNQDYQAGPPGACPKGHTQPFFVWHFFWMGAGWIMGKGLGGKSERGKREMILAGSLRLETCLHQLFHLSLTFCIVLISIFTKTLLLGGLSLMSSTFITVCTCGHELVVCGWSIVSSLSIILLSHWLDLGTTIILSRIFDGTM